MPKTVRHVLKAEEVILDGVCRLNIDPAAAAGECRMPSQGTPVARVVQTHPDHAVIEVICTCGKTIHLHCDYAADGSESAPQEPVTS